MANGDVDRMAKSSDRGLANLDYDSGTLLLDAWTETAVQRIFGQGIWVWDSRVRRWRTDACNYRLVRDVLATRNYGTIDRVPQWQTVNWSKIEIPPLRSEQQKAVDAWQQTRRGIVVMPTGTGKTEVAIQLMASGRCSTLVIAPVRDLMYQWHRRIFRALGYDAGILGDNRFSVKPITVTTYASACIHLAELGNRFQLLVFDECHHLAGPLRSDAARCSIASDRLGLTATWNPDVVNTNTAGVVRWDDILGPVVYELGISDVRGRTLAEYEVVRIPVALSDLERSRYDQLSEHVSDYVLQRRTDDPGFCWQDLCAETQSSQVASRILRAFREKQSIEERAEEKLRVLEDLFRLHPGERMIIFTGSNAMAREVSLRFLIPCLLSHCGKRERLDYLEGLRDGVYPAIVANQVLDEGVDLPELKIAVILGGKGSTRQAKQRLGRILRRQGEAKAILYEVVTSDTREVERSRKRRKNDAYEGTRHRKVRKRPGAS